MNDNSIRAFAQCPRFHKFGGIFSFPILTNILKKTVEQQLVSSLRTDDRNWLSNSNITLMKLIKESNINSLYMEGQVVDITSKLQKNLKEIFDTFNPIYYEIVTGPLFIPAKISKTKIELNISGIFKSLKSNTLHIIDFSPHTALDTIANDLTIHMKIDVMEKFIHDFYDKRSKAILHTYFLNKNNNMLCIDSSNPILNTSLKDKQSIITAIEAGISYPVNPCPNQFCLYKEKCQ